MLRSILLAAVVSLVGLSGCVWYGGPDEDHYVYVPRHYTYATPAPAAQSQPATPPAQAAPPGAYTPPPPVVYVPSPPVVYEPPVRYYVYEPEPIVRDVIDLVALGIILHGFHHSHHHHH